MRQGEGLISLGEWNSQWSHMQPDVGWALLFVSVTCLKGYIRGDLFAGTIKSCFLLNCLSVPYLSVRFLQHFLGDRPAFWRLWFVTSILLECISCTARRRSHQASMDSLIQGRDSSSQWVRVKALDAQWNLVRHRNQQGEGSTAHQTGKNLGSNSGLPQEAEGETELLRETDSKHLLWWSHVSQVRGAGWKYCAIWKCVRQL
jgi:hypothetical protein